MMGKWKNRTKMDIAKELLSNLVDSLSSNQQVQLALRVYGHQYPKKLQNCKDSRLEVPFSKDNHQDIIYKLDGIRPKGTTPIAYSLLKASSDFPSGNQFRNVIVLITDGEESCGADPCAVSLRLQKEQVFLQPFIIGLGNNFNKKSMDCLGKFHKANDLQSFRNNLYQVINRSLTPTRLVVDLQDGSGNPIADKSITLINQSTGLPQYEFIHYRDKRHKPDTFEIDPVPNYQFVINTIPQIKIKNPKIKAGEINVLRYKVREGQFVPTLKKINLYDNKLTYTIRNTNNQFIYSGLVNSPVQLLEGTYKVEIHTTPLAIKNNLKITENTENNLAIPDPGIVDIRFLSKGLGVIYKNSKNKSQWVMDLDSEKQLQSVILQPGSYRLVYRAINSPGKYTIIKPFDIKSGTTNKLTVH